MQSNLLILLTFLRLIVCIFIDSAPILNLLQISFDKLCVLFVY